MTRLALVIPERDLLNDVLRAVRTAGYRADAFCADAETISKSNASTVVIDVATAEDLEMIEALCAEDHKRDVVAIGADPGAELATRARRAGARAFLQKPFTLIELERILRTPSRLDTRKAQGILTVDPKMDHLLTEVERAAATEATICIRGENGTGKDVVARFIHRHSPRHAGPFVVINCAGIPESLAESELFGHVAGAFTGAIDARPGQIESASGGTLILDDVSELSLSLQPKLLRVLQEREVTPIGASSAHPVDVRIVATSQKDLQQQVELSCFREDLYFRLDVIRFELPPLRERPMDLPLLATSMIARFSREQGSDPPCLGDDALERLAQYSFPGNIRELENMMRRATILFPGRQLAADSVIFRGAGASLPDELPETLNLRELEKQTIRRALEARGGNRTHAARVLGISVRTLRNKIRLYELGDRFPADRAIRAGSISA